MANKDNTSMEVQAIKAAWKYCDDNSSMSVVYGAKHEDMTFKEYLMSDINERYSEQIPENIREKVVGYIMEHYNL